MIRVVLFDLGETLEHAGKLRSGATAALQGIRGLANAGGPIQIALVSDYEMAADPAGVEPLVQKYLAIVRQLGIADFFSPPDRHITLSTQVGVFKPDPKIFRLALQRLGLGTDLSQAVFITESPEHIEAARKLGMVGLRYGAEEGIPSWPAAVAILRAAIRAAAAEH